MGGHEGALALAAHEHVFGRHLVYRLAHRTLADLEARSEQGLARDGLARLPFARLQAVQEQCLDLLVQRAEGRRRLAARSAGQNVGGIGHDAIVLHQT
jgi:hypothetical protein